MSLPRVSDLESAVAELTAVRADMLSGEEAGRAQLEAVHPIHADSARNLLHYLALRRRDLRPLQRRLAALGLSSLGRAESHVLATVDAVLEVLNRLAGRPRRQRPPSEAGMDFARGERLLAEHTEALAGPERPGRAVRIMVTMPAEAADDPAIIRDLLQQGMDCMRINCAHDDEATWLRMIEHLGRAERSLERSCRIVMDLAGPKLRTGPLQPGPAVLRIKPHRDAFGRLTAAARVWLTGEEAGLAAGAPSSPAPPSRADAVLPVPGEWLEGLATEDRLSFTDAGGSRRSFEIVDTTPAGCWAESVRTAYVVPGTRLRVERPGAAGAEARVGPLPPLENPLSLAPGDQLILTRNLLPGRPAVRDGSGSVLTPATIGCTIPGVFDDVLPGEPIWFDDGRIGGTVEKIEEARVLVRITRTRQGGGKLRADKGINLPESNLALGALTPKDLRDLEFVARHADVVELSFANTAGDVELLQRRLALLGDRQPALVLKIETRRGFENLPEMLLTAMRSPRCGVMIARGDLAVECGFERLAEVQEEILWICEAALVPVIWATQVLETLAKEGMPSRAEVTDAAMGHRAECVMLNKGPHVQSAVRVLDDILRRMHAHQAKKRSMLRELRLAHSLSPGRDPSPALATGRALAEARGPGS